MGVALPSLLRFSLDQNILLATYPLPHTGVALIDVSESEGRFFAVSAPPERFSGRCWQPALFELLPPATVGGAGLFTALADGGNGQVLARGGNVYYTSSYGCCDDKPCQPYDNVACLKM